ncbi:uncharacterized protein LOC119646204 [Hermetia illucens]|nr:uncharacterized protein LOC119646204 [Hermetia illucens]
MKIHLLVLAVLCTASLSAEVADSDVTSGNTGGSNYDSGHDESSSVYSSTDSGYGIDNWNWESSADSGDDSWDDSRDDSRDDSGNYTGSASFDESGSASVNDSSSDRPLRPQHPRRNRWHGNRRGDRSVFKKHHPDRNNRGDKTPSKSIQFSYFFGNGWK